MPVAELQARTRIRPLGNATTPDAVLVERLRSGDEQSFEAIFKRHHAPLLSYCRHMLSNQDEAEDALQQAFIRAHRALLAGPSPRELRPWLYAIARNCCLSAIAARRPTAALEDHTPSLAGLSEEVHNREDLRELVADIGQLPEHQRSALLLAELDDLSHQAIATIVGCPVSKVKALVYQARTTLIAEREARNASCRDIREQLSVAHGGELRRGPLRRHLSMCAGCRDFQHVISVQRQSLAAVLPVLPAAGLAARILAHSAAHTVGGATMGQAGAALTPGVGAAAGTVSATSAGALVGGGVLTKLAVVGTVAALATAGAVTLPHRPVHLAPHRAARSQTASPATGPSAVSVPGTLNPAGPPGTPGSLPSTGLLVPGALAPLANTLGTSPSSPVLSGITPLPASHGVPTNPLSPRLGPGGHHRPSPGSHRPHGQRRHHLRKHRRRHRLRLRHTRHRRLRTSGTRRVPVPAVRVGAVRVGSPHPKLRVGKQGASAVRPPAGTGAVGIGPHAGANGRRHHPAAGGPPSASTSPGTTQSGQGGRSGSSGSGSSGSGLGHGDGAAEHPGTGTANNGTVSSHPGAGNESSSTGKGAHRRGSRPSSAGTGGSENATGRLPEENILDASGTTSQPLH